MTAQDEPKTPATQDAQEMQGAQDIHEIIKDGKANPHKITGLGSDEKRAARLEKLRAALDPGSPGYKNLEAIIRDATAQLAASLPYLQLATDLLKEIDALEPFINAELSKEPGGETLDDYLDKYTAGQLLDIIQDPSNPFTKALETARTTAGQQLENIAQTGVPKRYQVNQTLLNKDILTGTKDFGSIINTGNKHKLPTYKQGRKQLYVTASAKTKNIKVYGEPSEFDAAVGNAVTTLIDEAVAADKMPIFTLDQIARCMLDKTDQQEISKQMQNEVRDSFYRGNDIKVDIDATDELLARGAELNGEKITSFVVKNNPYFDFREIEAATRNGSIVTAYWFKETPIASVYAQLTNGMQRISSDLLDIKEEIQTPDGSKWVSVPSNKYRVSIVNYLLRRVYQANQAFDDYKDKCRKAAKDGKKPPELPTDFIILFSSVFEAAEITNKNTITNAKAYIKTVMHYWKHKKHIKGYEVRKKGKSADAIILKYEV